MPDEGDGRCRYWRSWARGCWPDSPTTTRPASRPTPLLGTDYGYQLLWVLLASTLALMVFHDLGARLGVVTGQGLIGLIRHRYGVSVSAVALVALVTANLGTAAAEFAGIAAGSELLGVSRYVAVPLSAVLVSWLVLAGSFHRVEHVLMALAAVFVAYVGAGLLAHPDWSEAFHGLVTPRMSFGHQETLIVAATVGTTLAPWGLSFIQSYAVDKKLTTKDLGYERTDVILGAALTGIIGFFVVVACAGTLHRQGLHINSAEDAAQALVPVAGDLAGTLFAFGLIGAALLAAAILPLSTAYSICDFAGTEAALDAPSARLACSTWATWPSRGSRRASSWCPASRWSPCSSPPRCSTPSCCCRCWC